MDRGLEEAPWAEHIFAYVRPSTGPDIWSSAAAVVSNFKVDGVMALQKDGQCLRLPSPRVSAPHHTN